MVPPTKLAVVTICVLALASDARADDGDPQASPPFGSTPRLGAARLSLSSVALPAEDVGASVLGAAIGLPYGSGLRTTLPLLVGDGSDAGSPSLSLTLSGARWFGTLELEILAELGVRTSSLGLDEIVVGEKQLASRGWGRHHGAHLRLRHQSGLSACTWYKAEPDFERFGLGLDYSFLAAGRMSLGAGIAAHPSDTGPPPKAVGFAAYRPRWLPDISISLFWAIPVAKRDSALPGADAAAAGIALSFDHAFWGQSSGAMSLDLQEDGGGGVLPLDANNAPVPLSDFVVPNKVNVFAFEASWCGPCRHVHRELLDLAARNPDLHIRTIDADEKSRLFEANGGRGLPLVVVFGRDGHEVGRLNSYRPNAVSALVAGAGE